MEDTLRNGRLMPREESRAGEKVRLLGAGGSQGSVRDGRFSPAKGGPGWRPPAEGPSGHSQPTVQVREVEMNDKGDGQHHQVEASPWASAKALGSAVLSGLKAPSFYAGSPAASQPEDCVEQGGGSSPTSPLGGARQARVSPFMSEPAPRAASRGDVEATGQVLSQFVPKRRDEAASPNSKTKFDEQHGGASGVSSPSGVQRSTSWWQSPVSSL